MAEISGELIYEMLKRIQSDVSGLKEGQRELKAEVGALRGTVISMQQDIHNIYGMLARTEQRLDRIETRLDLREMSERGQTPYDPAT
jgi:predicted  nucleic acid-binding Zn-ribbon protein